MFEKYKKVYKADYEKWYKENEAYRERVAADQDRLKFHLMPKTGWLNDPNGLCQFNGTYHIYYQYTPFEPTSKRGQSSLYILLWTDDHHAKCHL